jgi:succinoglycan biosynthesis protein ExoA
LLDQLCADQAAEQARIVVADGGSTDRSVELVRARAESDARIVLMPNPKRRQGAGVNLAVERYGEGVDTFIRIDAHSAYPPLFLSRLLEAQERTGASSVTVAMRAVANTGGCFQRATACAQNSLLGAGGSAHRKAGTRRWVDHGHHALFTTRAFRAAGGYDETFAHNEDAELDARLGTNGDKILLAADILIDYFPRSAPGSLALQYFNYGRGRARTWIKHRTPLKPRQLGPILVAPSAIAALLWPIWNWVAIPFLAWFGVCIGYGAWLGVRARDSCAGLSGVAAAIMHASWSVGFCCECGLRVGRAFGSSQSDVA